MEFARDFLLLTCLPAAVLLGGIFFMLSVDLVADAFMAFQKWRA